jgi:outer membrane receptor protein involved in Fe transport
VVNVTHQDPENRSQIAVFDGKRLPGRYENAFLGRLEGRFGAYTVYGEYVAETGTYYDTANLLPAEDKNEINAGISWSRGPWLLRLDARNLTDERIEDFNGFPLPGRSVFASVKYTFATRY